MKVYGKIVGILVGAFFISQFLGRTLFLNASPKINPEFLAQLPQNVGNFLASPLGGIGNQETNTENETCKDPTGTEIYDNAVLALGPHIAANNNPTNFKQIRKLYNCENADDPSVATKYIPVTVVYDLLFLKGSVEGIKNNLVEMKKYGLFPIIRVSSYTDGTGKWIKIGPSDARIMGQNLAEALQQSNGFAAGTPVMYLNEVNLNIEWGGQVNPAEFAASLAAFSEGLGSAGQLMFPALSYGATPDIGMTPADFLAGAFNSGAIKNQSLSGVALNIYGNDGASIQSQHAAQKNAFDPYVSFLRPGFMTIISELGPTDGAGIIYNCDQNGPWPAAAQPVFSGFVSSPSRALYGTTTCFANGKIYLVAVKYSAMSSKMYPFDIYGGPGNNSPTSTPVPGNPTPTTPPGNNPTATPLPGQPTTPPNPTLPPGNNQGGTVQIIIHTDSTTGAVWNEANDSVSVYLEGPTARGRFGETLRIFGTNKTSCTSNGGFPYSCTIGTAEWKGADGKSGTTTGDYSVFILNAPSGWTVVDGASSSQGVLSAGQTLTLDLAVKKN